MDELRKNVKKSLTVFIVITIIIVFVLVWMHIMKYLKNKDYYGASNFGIKTIYSSVDYNNNGIDDYSDFVLGARKDKSKAVISAFDNAGYNLDKVSDDLIAFFIKYSEVLTLNLDKIAEWQPGDIVFFNETSGIISDKRNKDGVPFVIYEDGEKDILENVNIKFHFRFDSSKIDLNILG